MQQIDVSQWKTFKISSLFEKQDLNILKKNFNGHFDVSTKETKEFNLPLVNAKKGNNGIMYYGRKQDFDHTNMSIDVVQDGAASVGNVYPEPQETGVYHNAYLLKCKNTVPNENCLIFLSTIIQKTVKRKFSYDNKCTWPRLKKETIKLPIDKNGNPNWQFMDNFIAKLHNLANKYVTQLNSIKTFNKSIDVTHWHTFKIGNLFDKPDLYVLKKGFERHLDLSLNKTQEFNLPLVNAKHGNNGIMFYGREKDFEHINMSIDVVQNGAESTGDVYPEPQETGVYQDAYLIKCKSNVPNANCLTFLASVIQKTVKQKFSYDNKCIWRKLKKENIKLPVDVNGQPDWQYMDNFIEQKKQEAQHKLSILSKLN